MGKADAAAREYLSDPTRFADLFNHGAFGGEELVDPSELRAADSSAVVAGTERRRDLVREWTRMEGGGAAYALLSIEEQTAGHLAMPARCALYDAMSYVAQIRGIAAANRREGMAGATPEELLSGMHEADRLRPVVTLVLYLGPGDWRWPETLHALVGEADERVMALVPDYRVNLVAPARMSDEELDAFDTELGLALKYVKHSRDKLDLGKMVEGDARYRSVGADTASFLNAITGSRLRLESADGRVDMCKAIDDMRAESELKGRREGERKNLLGNLRSLLANTDWDLATTFEKLGVPEAERASLAAELGAAV